MQNNYRHLDHQIVEIVQKIDYLIKHQHLNRHSQIRVEQWIKKICQITVNNVWKKNRNQYAQALLEQVEKGKLEEPFSKVPPEGPLNNLGVKRDITTGRKTRPQSSKAKPQPGPDDHINDQYMQYLKASNSQLFLRHSHTHNHSRKNTSQSHKNTNTTQSFKNTTQSFKNSISSFKNNSQSNLRSSQGSLHNQQQNQTYRQQLKKAYQDIDQLAHQNQVMHNQLRYKDEQYKSLLNQYQIMQKQVHHY